MGTALCSVGCVVAVVALYALVYFAWWATGPVTKEELDWLQKRDHEQQEQDIVD